MFSCVSYVVRSFTLVCCVGFFSPLFCDVELTQNQPVTGKSEHAENAAEQFPQTPSKKLKIVLLGLPGAGKGVQSRLMQNALGVPLVGMGDLLRKEVAAQTELGKDMQEIMARGDLVPDDIAAAVFAKYAMQNDGFIADGFPRNINQARLLSAHLEKHGAALHHVFYLDVPKEVLVERLTQRIVCLSCGAPKPKKYEGVCTACQDNNWGQRADDKKEIILKRIADQEARDKPLIDFFEAKGLLRRITADKKSESAADPSLVTQEILAHIERQSA